MVTCAPHERIVPMMRSYINSACLVAPLLFSACGGGNNANFAVELAAFEGNPDCTVASVSFPADASCLALRAYALEDGVRAEPVGLLRPGTSRGAPRVAEVRFAYDARDFVVDVDTEATSYELESVLYSGVTGEPFARGAMPGWDLNDRKVQNRLRLARFEQWSCAGPSTGSSPEALPRALHAAIALPTGDVLVIGGVKADEVDPVGFAGGASLRREVELYSVTRGRFVTLDATDLAGDAGFGRVFFSAQRVSDTVSRTVRLRVYGGFEAAGDALAVRFDSQQARGFYHSPVLISSDAAAAPPVELVLDLDALTMRVNALAGVPSQLSGSTVSAEIPAVSSRWASLVEVSGLQTSAPATCPTANLAGGVGLNAGAAVDVVALSERRFGAALSRAGTSSDDVLVIGGNVQAADAAALDSTLIERVDVASSTSALVTPDVGAALLEPLAFATATPLSDTQVVLAGGMAVAEQSACSDLHPVVLNSVPTNALLVGSVGSAATIDFELPSNAAAFESTIFHSATPYNGGVMIVGGAQTQTMMSGMTVVVSHLWATDQVGRVADDGTGVAYTELAPLTEARWGHAAALLPGGQLLITGGLSRDANGLSARSRAEIYDLTDVPEPLGADSCVDVPL